MVCGRIYFAVILRKSGRKDGLLLVHGFVRNGISTGSEIHQLWTGHKEDVRTK